MNYIRLPSRSTTDDNASSDINQIQANLDALKGGLSTDAPVSDIATLYNTLLNVFSKKDIDNLVVKPNATNYNNQLDISFTGLRIESTYQSNISTTIDITSSLDTGTEAISTWYYVWCFTKDDGSYTFKFSISNTAPTVPSGYTHKRCIGAVYNNASGNFVLFSQKNKDVLIGTNVTSASTATVTTAVSISTLVSKLACKLYTTGFVNSDAGDLMLAGKSTMDTTWHRAGIHQYVVPLMEEQTFYYRVSAGTGNVYINAYEINI